MYLHVWIQGNCSESDPEQSLPKSPHLLLNLLLQCFHEAELEKLAGLQMSAQCLHQEASKSKSMSKDFVPIKLILTSKLVPEIIPPPPPLCEQNSRWYLSSKTTRGHPQLWCFDRKCVYLCRVECVSMQMCVQKRERETHFPVYKSLTKIKRLLCRMPVPRLSITDGKDTGLISGFLAKQEPQLISLV